MTYDDAPARRKWYDDQMQRLVEECHMVKHAMRSIGIRARVSPYIKPPRHHIGDVRLDGVRVVILDV